MSRDQPEPESLSQRRPLVKTLACEVGEDLPHNVNSNDEDRVDIAARGFWQRCEKALFDVKVFNLYASTH